MNPHAPPAQMRGNQAEVFARGAFDEHATSGSRLRAIMTERTRPVRIEDLHRTMNRIAAEQQMLIRIGGNLQANLARCVTRQRDDPPSVDNLVAGLHEAEKATLKDRQHAVPVTAVIDGRIAGEFLGAMVRFDLG